MIKVAGILILIQLFISGRSQDMEFTRKIVRTLTSPEYKGRGYIGNGHQKAAHYIAGRYKEIGLESVFSNAQKSPRSESSYFQSFPVTLNTFPSKMRVKIDGILISAGSEFLVHPSSPSVKGSFSIITISKKMLTDPDTVQKIINASKGKFIAIDSRQQIFENKTIQKKADEAIERMSSADEVSSAGTIIITDEKLTWGISTHKASKPVLIVNSSRVPENPSEITVNIKSELSQVKTNNVIGSIRGTHCPDSFLFIIAHYDHLGKMGRKVYFPGANDNASGVAMLLNLARYFKANPPKYSMVFLALAAEESGLQGSLYFTENSPVDLRKIVFLLNFDLAGTGEEGIKVVNATLYPDQFKLLDQLNSEGDYLKDVQERGAACNSDHCIFHQKGVPCFYIYTLGGSRAYHDINDTYESLSLIEFSDYTKLMIEFLNKISITK